MTHVTVGARTYDPLQRRRELHLKSYLDSLYAGYSEPLLGLRPLLHPVLYSTLLIIPGAKLGVLEAPDDIVKRGGAEEVLLLEAQLLPLEHVVVRVENAGDVLSQVPV